MKKLLALLLVVVMVLGMVACGSKEAPKTEEKKEETSAPATEEKKEEPKQRVQAQVISDETRKVLEAAVSQITGGKGRITDIKKV